MGDVGDGHGLGVLGGSQGLGVLGLPHLKYKIISKSQGKRIKTRKKGEKPRL